MSMRTPVPPPSRLCKSFVQPQRRLPLSPELILFQGGCRGLVSCIPPPGPRPSSPPGRRVSRLIQVHTPPGVPPRFRRRLVLPAMLPSLQRWSRSYCRVRLVTIPTAACYQFRVPPVCHRVWAALRIYTLRLLLPLGPPRVGLALPRRETSRPFATR